MPCSMYKTIRAGSPRRAVTVAAITSSAKRLPTALKAMDAACGGGLEAARTRPGFKGDAGAISVGSDAAILAGLGDATPTLASLRTLGSRLVRALHAMGASAARAGASESRCGPLGKQPAAAAQAIAEGMLLANWRQETWRGTAAKGEPATGTLILTASTGAARGGLLAHGRGQG